MTRNERVAAATSQEVRGEESDVQRLEKYLLILGPGIITGAADDDPSGIATYSQTGAQFGCGQLWTALFMLPLLVGVQEACARIRVVTGKGIAALVCEHFSKPVLYVVSIVAQAAAANLLFPFLLAGSHLDHYCRGRRACSGPKDWIGN
jgi:Mn2+/Fe2+ NRAMP family transporter